jgi:spore coat protein A, manganese oxidase
MIPRDIFTTQVAMIPHIHGLTTVSGFDGNPRGWFTSSGVHGPEYFSGLNLSNNSVTFIYENKNIPGVYYYHDHTLSITRINVLSGLKGVYVIDNGNQTQE